MNKSKYNLGDRVVILNDIRLNGNTVVYKGDKVKVVLVRKDTTLIVMTEYGRELGVIPSEIDFDKEYYRDIKLKEIGI